MPRYKLLLEYDGGPFCGFQLQENGPSIQGALEAAILAYCGEAVRLQVAGRTDAGVHAEGQVAHLDLSRAVSGETMRDALNAHLRPAPISVLLAEAVDDGFHARFSATARHYRYRILNRRAPPAIERGRVWHIMNPLDVRAMDEAAKLLLGKHDFTTFRAAECQAKSPEKNLDRLDVVRAGEEVHILASARSFLHHQVRSMAGSLKLVGLGKWGAANLKKALDARNRAACGPVAPAEGLCLTRVDYREMTQHA